MSEAPQFDEPEDAEGRLNWFTFQRAYPFDTFPAEGRRKSWHARAAMAPVAEPEAAAATWVSIGPTPSEPQLIANQGLVSGRINAIAVSPANPNVVLVGAATGGLWRSSDSGANFTPVSDNQVDLAVSSIAFARSNNAIVYAGMGESASGNGGVYFGSGVLKSIDGGQTWARVNNNTLPPGTIKRIEVNPTNPDEVYAAQFYQSLSGISSNGGFYRSTDGGVNWTRTMAGSARDLAFHPTAPGVIYLTMTRVNNQPGPAPGLYRSQDGGLTWTNIYVSPLPSFTFDIRVATTPADPQKIYLYLGGPVDGIFQLRVEVSSDGGASFKNLGAPGVDNGQFGYNTYLLVNPTDANTIYLGSRDIYKSTNGGLSYSNLNHNFSGFGVDGCTNQGGCGHEDQSNLHTDQSALALSPNNSNILYAGNDGGLWKSVDGGVTYQSLNATLSLTQFVGFALHPTNAAISYGGSQDNGSQRRLGTPPNRWRFLRGGDGGDCVINPLNPSMVFASSIRASGIFRYVNDGQTFSAIVATQATFGDGARAAFYPPFTGNGVDAALYLGTYRLWVSNNNGDTWTAPGGTFDLTKGGSDVLSAIGVARSNTKVIYTGSNQGRALVSNNGGANWTDITAGLPNRSITQIVAHPNNPAEAYLSVSGYGSGHIFKTTNFGANWQNVSANLPDTPVNALLYDPLNPNTLYAGTDIGVFRRSAGSTNWSAFNNGMPAAVVMAFAAQKSGRIQLATYGRGAYELTGHINAAASVSAASFKADALAPNSVVAGFGAGLATRVATAESLPLPNELAGTTVRVLDSAGVERAAPLFFVAPGQVNYLMPPGTAGGTATVIIVSEDGTTSTSAVNITPLAPGLFAANANGQGVAAAVVLRVKADGSQVIEPLATFDAAQNRFVAMPIEVSNAAEQVYGVFFGTGFSGVQQTREVAVRIGGQAAEVSYAGAQGSLAGLDQLNVRLARELAGRKEVEVLLTATEVGRTANVLTINVK